MKRTLLVLCTLLFLIGCYGATTAMANQTLQYPILTSADDAEEGDDGPGVMDVDSSDLELAWDHDDPSRAQTIGLHFSNVTISSGAEIVEAYIQFACDEADKNRDPFAVTISGEASDNSEQFQNIAFNISSRSRTIASVTWSDISDWTVEGEAGVNQRTSDLKTIIQEIIARDGWDPGNSMGFILEGAGTRTAESFDGATELAPTLVIVLPSEETYRITSSTDDAEEGDDGPGVIDIDSSDLELAWDHDDPARAQAIGLRFKNVTIPKGATILSASIQFACDEADKNRNPFSVTIAAEADGNAASLTTDDFNISSRPRTNASVEWADIPDWTIEHQAGENQRTPDLAAVIQEIVNRSDWEEGNALAFIIAGQGTRTAESFDGAAELSPALSVTFIGEQTAPSNDKYRLTWNDDPATTMTIAWDQLRGIDPVVYYDTEDFGTDYHKYSLNQAPTRVDAYRGMQNNFAELTGLTPDTAYYFVIKDSQTVSRRMWFKTAPDSPKPFTFISGGDTKSSGKGYLAGLLSNRMVPKLRPLFILFGGDFTSHDGTNDVGWQNWFTDWATLTMTEDGRVFPILPIAGNHEDGDLEMLYHLFDVGNNDPEQSAKYPYYSRSLGGNLLKIIGLHTSLARNGLEEAHALQTRWFEDELAASGEYTFVVTAHHKPFRPHNSGKTENYYLDPWAALYHQYEVDLDVDNDSHMNKITFPIRLCEEIAPGVQEEGCFQDYIRDDTNGTMMIGEGSWGAWARQADDEKPWTLYSSSVQQIKWIQVVPAEGEIPAQIDIRTVITGTHDADGNLVDHVSGVGANTEDDVFALPDNIYLSEIPFYGTVVHYPFQAVSGDPPNAPINLTGAATSYTDLDLSWTNTAAPAVVRSLYLERKVGDDDDWGLVDNTLNSDTTSYSQGNLNDGTTYSYRLRAHNVFGFSEYSNTVQVLTPVDPRTKMLLQQGLNGYSGTVDLELRNSSPDTVFDGAEAMTVDMEDGGVVHGMLRFKDIFAFNSGPVPVNALIESAELRLYTVGSTQSNVSFHRMLTNWPDDCTWDTLGGDGVTPDDLEALAAADDILQGPKAGNYHFLDVTATLQTLQKGEGNFGWGIINDGTDGWDIATSENSVQELRPLLTVYYTLPGDLDQDNDVDRDDIRLIRQYLRQPADNCLNCDIDGDGRITIRDARKMARMCTRPRCGTGGN